MFIEPVPAKHLLSNQEGSINIRPLTGPSNSRDAERPQFISALNLLPARESIHLS